MCDKRELGDRELKTVSGGLPLNGSETFFTGYETLPEGWTIIAEGVVYVGDYSCNDSTIQPMFGGKSLNCYNCPNKDTATIGGQECTVCKAGKTPSFIYGIY